MRLLNWQDDYLVGDEVIDHDHKELFHMINDFYDAFQESRKRSQLSPLLTRLVHYAEQHFQREEKIMAHHAYPELEKHHLIHEELFETIFELNKRLETDPLPLDRDAVMFLKHWLVDHILQEDKKIGTFIESKKSSD